MTMFQVVQMNFPFKSIVLLNWIFQFLMIKGELIRKSLSFSVDLQVILMNLMEVNFRFYFDLQLT